MKKAIKSVTLFLIIALATSLLVSCDTTKNPETTPEPTLAPQVGDVIDNGDGTVTTITQLNNPILPGYHADPSAYLFDDTYYIYSTTDGYIVSGNGGWPMIWKSTDFVNWSAVEMELLNSKGKKFSEAADGYWAPSMAKVGEKYYLFFTLADYQIRVATGDSPEGPFTVQGGDLVPKNKTIDPQAFVDDDGKLYITYLMYEHGASGDIMTVISELDPEDPTEVIETKIIEELSRVYREGQEILKKDGKYYLFYSEGNWTGTDYHVCYAMADSIYGPYTIKGTILESADANLVGTGHHSTLQLKDGQYVMVYHRQSIPFIGFGYRQVCVDNMLFNEDGTIKKVQASYDGIVLGVTTSKEEATLKNVAQGATVTYTSDQKERIYQPDFLVDGTNQTLFKTANDEGEKEILIELAQEYEIQKTELCFEYGSKYYRYKIDVSTDGTNWTEYANQTSGKVRVTPRVDTGVAKAKYIRITLVDCESMNRNYGSKNLKDPQRWKEPARYGLFEFKAYAYVTE